MARPYARTARRIVDFTKMKYAERCMESTFRETPELRKEITDFLTNPPEGEGVIFVQMMNIFPKMFNHIKGRGSNLEMFDYEQMDSEDINMLFAMFSDHFSGESVVNNSRRLNSEDVARMETFVKKLKEKNMSKIIPVAAIIAQNKSSLQKAATLKVGTTTIDLVSTLLGPKLPEEIRKYANTPLFKVLSANAMFLLINYFRPNDKRLQLLGSAVMDASHVQALDMIPIDEFIDTLLNSVAIDSLLPTAE